MTENVDFKITRDGTWYHNGDPIKRDALAKLFSDRALKIDEAGKYWLQTPYEKYPVDVEDVPYIITDYECGNGVINFTTNMNEIIELGEDHAWELRDGIPYVEIRSGLFARIGRAAFYNLIETFGESIMSNGKSFKLGDVE